MNFITKGIGDKIAIIQGIFINFPTIYPKIEIRTEYLHSSE